MDESTLGPLIDYEEVESNTWSGPAITSPITHTSYSNYQKEESIRLVLSIRERLSEFLNGSNVLLKILDPQTIRETVKELRLDIRNIKKDMDILEIDIIKYQEEELGRKEDPRYEESKYEELPF
jgi:hypothetical protein